MTKNYQLLKGAQMGGRFKSPGKSPKRLNSGRRRSGGGGGAMGAPGGATGAAVAANIRVAVRVRSDQEPIQEFTKIVDYKVREKPSETTLFILTLNLLWLNSTSINVPVHRREIFPPCPFFGIISRLGCLWLVVSTFPNFSPHKMGKY